MDVNEEHVTGTGTEDVKAPARPGLYEAIRAQLAQAADRAAQRREANPLVQALSERGRRLREHYEAHGGLPGPDRWRQAC